MTAITGIFVTGMSLMTNKFPVVPTDPDAEIEWFDTKEQAELYAAATGGKTTDDLLAVDSRVWLARVRRQVRAAIEPVTAKYIARLLDTKPKP